MFFLHLGNNCFPGVIIAAIDFLNLAAKAEASSSKDLGTFVFVFDQKNTGFGGGEEVGGVGGEFAGENIKIFLGISQVGGVAGFGKASFIDGAEDEAAKAIEEGFVNCGGGFGMGHGGSYQLSVASYQYIGLKGDYGQRAIPHWKGL